MPSPGETVTLVQCTDSKRNQEALAEDLYDESRYFRKMRAWARAKRQPWFILSAKHGLVSPIDRIEPYDEFGLSEKQAQTIAKELEQMEVVCVHVCAGKNYTGVLIPELEKQGIDVVDNFAGMQIGNREKELQRRTDELSHATIGEC